MLMVSARTAATTAAALDTSPAIAHPVAKVEAVVVGVTGVVVEAGEEDAAIQVPTSKSIKMSLQHATERL